MIWFSFLLISFSARAAEDPWKDIARAHSNLQLYKTSSVDLSKNSVVDHFRVDPNEAPFVPRQDPANCGTVNSLKDKFGKPRAQIAFGNCFAQVAADVFTYYGGTRIAHFDLALKSYAQNTRQSKQSLATVSGGLIYETIDLGTKLGVCPEAQLPDFVESLMAMRRETKSTDRPLTQFLWDMVREVEKLTGRSTEQLLADETGSCLRVITAQWMFPRLSTQHIVTAFSNAANPQEAYDFLSNYSCRPQLPKLPANFRWNVVEAPQGTRVPPGHHLLKYIDRQLSRKNPVAIAYDYRPFQARPRGDDGAHGSIIVGREFRDGECKYLVRNPSGASCGGFRPPYNEARNCEPGHFWVTEGDVRNYVTQIEYGPSQ